MVSIEIKTESMEIKIKMQPTEERRWIFRRMFHVVPDIEKFIEKLILLSKTIKNTTKVRNCQKNILKIYEKFSKI